MATTTRSEPESACRRPVVPLAPLCHRQLRRRLGRVRRQGALRRPITTRPTHIATRQQRGHWKIDTMVGRGSPVCLLSAVERATGYAVLGQLAAHTARAFATRAIQLFRTQPHGVRTVTADKAPS